MIAALAALSLVGCGAGGGRQAAATAAPAAATPVASATATATPIAPAATARAPAAATATPTVAASPEEQPGGAGDEEAARTALLVAVGPGGVTPAALTAPAFLGLELQVRNALAGPVTVTLPGRPPLTVAAGGSARAALDGLRPGRYRLDAGTSGAAVLTVTAG